MRWLGGKPAVEAMRFRDIGSSLQAAMDGNGVALGCSLLVADALSQRRSVRLGSPSEARVCSKAQIARWSDPFDQTAAHMAAWLVATAEQEFKADGSFEATASDGVDPEGNVFQLREPHAGG